MGTQLPPWWSGDRHPGGVHGGVHPEILGGSHAHILPVHWGHQGRSVLPGPPRFPAHPENIQTPPGSTGHEPRGLSYSTKAKNQKFKEEALTERQGGYRGRTANPGFLIRGEPPGLTQTTESWVRKSQAAMGVGEAVRGREAAQEQQETPNWEGTGFPTLPGGTRLHPTPQTLLQDHTSAAHACLLT